MEQPVSQPLRMTVDEYLAFDFASKEKWEYIDGRVVMMAGGSDRHALITGNIGGMLYVRLRGSPCRVYSADLRIQIDKAGRYSYADVSVVCGPLEVVGDNAENQTGTNPRVIVEVLSPSSEEEDRGPKLWRYMLLDSLRDYVLVWQDRARVEVLSRREDGSWNIAYFVGPNASAFLVSLNVHLPLSEIYDGAVLDEPRDQT